MPINASNPTKNQPPYMPHQNRTPTVRRGQRLPASVGHPADTKQTPKPTITPAKASSKRAITELIPEKNASTGSTSVVTSLLYPSAGDATTMSRMRNRVCLRPLGEGPMAPPGFRRVPYFTLSFEISKAALGNFGFICSSVSTIIWETARLRNHFLFDGMTNQGAVDVLHRLRTAS
jgi:hypothetical protein